VPFAVWTFSNLVLDAFIRYKFFMKLLAVILNYKTAEMTLDSVRSLMKELESIPDSKVTIVDNDSDDGSIDLIREGIASEGWTDRVRVIASDYNGGFAYGNNFAIAPALEALDKPDYLYLLNSDAFPDTGCVTRLVDYLDSNPSVGIAGSYVHGPDGDPHETAFRFPSVYSDLEAPLGIGIVSRLLDRWIVALPIPEETRRVDWLAGASMLVRREVVDEIGLLDDTYFLYFEETDFCLRAFRADWMTHYVRDSSVTHIGSVSTGMKDRSKSTPSYWYASRHHYFLKNHGRLTLWAANLVYVFGSVICRIRYKLIGRSMTHTSHHHLRDFIRYNFRLGSRPSGHPARRAQTRDAPESV